MAVFRIITVFFNTEYCNVLNFFYSKFHRVVGGQLARLERIFRIDAELIFPVRAIKAAGAAVLRRDRLAAVVVVETGLALHELFKGPVAAGSEVHRPSPPFCVWAKRKAADFFKICGLAGEQNRALSYLTTPCFCLSIQLL